VKNEKNNYRNNLQDQRLSEIEKHISVINDELGDIRIKMGCIKTDVSWLKKFIWIIASASIGGLIAGILNLFFK